MKSMWLVCDLSLLMLSAAAGAMTASIKASNTFNTSHLSRQVTFTSPSMPTRVPKVEVHTMTAIQASADLDMTGVIRVSDTTPRKTGLPGPSNRLTWCKLGRETNRRVADIMIKACSAWANSSYWVSNGHLVRIVLCCSLITLALFGSGCQGLQFAGLSTQLSMGTCFTAV